jgi:hypothetical protein
MKASIMLLIVNHLFLFENGKKELIFAFSQKTQGFHNIKIKKDFVNKIGVACKIMRLYTFS